MLTSARQLDANYSLTSWLSLAEEAARRAGAYLAQGKSSERLVVADLERDVKLLADRKAEKLIISKLRKSTDFTIFAEEVGTLVGEDIREGIRWIVDPLDGSLNYQKGIPLCCVSVGLWQKDEPILGVIYDFNRKELFSGIVGIGAWLNCAPIRVSRTRVPERAILCTGFPVGTSFSPDAIVKFVRQIRKYKKVRLLGSAALSLAYVAAGRSDAYYERDIKKWDVAAGLAIVQAAGGTIARVSSAAQDGMTVYAGTSSLPRPNLGR